MNSIGGVNVVVWVLEINCLGRRVRRIDRQLGIGESNYADSCGELERVCIC